jgi:maltooligosyltrehalose trehalohydrolase
MMAPVLSYWILVSAIFQKSGSFYHPEASEFIVWAPLRSSVELVLVSPDPAVHPMERDEWGYWKISIPAQAGTRYFFRLDEHGNLPDPASISQPDGVHGASELLDRNDFAWDDEQEGSFSE